MEIKVKASTMVKPLTAKPSTTLRLSNMDLTMPLVHTRLCYFYRNTGDADFFDATLLKEALSRALVVFPPMAGRLSRDCNDRVQINCNGEGALFVEAESDGTLDDFGDFRPRPELSLAPPVDYSGGISSFPLLLVQVTRFKCGGVCIGEAVNHYVVDATSGFHFFNTWAELARGAHISTPAFLERCEVLSARDPPQVKFTHVEYQPPPTLKKTLRGNSEPTFTTFKLTRDQLKALKEDPSTGGCSTYMAVAAHLWRCVTVARALPEDQETRLYIPVDGRRRFQPPLPQGYFGNVIFQATCSALCGELVSNPLKFAVDKIRGAIARMDDEYLRSCLDYLEMEGELDPDLLGPFPYKSPNFGINSWARFPIYDADFGWQRPVHAGLCTKIPEGISFVLPNPKDDGSLLVGIALPDEQLQVFKTAFTGYQSQSRSPILFTVPTPVSMTLPSRVSLV